MASKKFTGKMRKTITNGYGEELKQGEDVVVFKRKQFDERGIWNGKWEYHYQSPTRRVLIRMEEFLLV